MGGLNFLSVRPPDQLCSGDRNVFFGVVALAWLRPKVRSGNNFALSDAFLLQPTDAFLL